MNFIYYLQGWLNTGIYGSHGFQKSKSRWILDLDTKNFFMDLDLDTKTFFLDLDTGFGYQKCCWDGGYHAFYGF